MNREVIRSFLLTSQHFKERASYDIFHHPELNINSLEKTKNGYRIQGILHVVLGLCCKEENQFDCIVSYTSNELTLNTKVQAINRFTSIAFSDSKQHLIKGAPSMHFDKFCISMVNGEKYLFQYTDETDVKVFNVDEGYSLTMGISEEMRNNELSEEKIVSNNKRRKLFQEVRYRN